MCSRRAGVNVSLKKPPQPRPDDHRQHAAANAPEQVECDVEVFPCRAEVIEVLRERRERRVSPNEAENESRRSHSGVWWRSTRALMVTPTSKQPLRLTTNTSHGNTVRA